MATTFADRAVVEIRTVLCKSFFQGRKQTPNRKFCNYFSGQPEDLLKFCGLSNDSNSDAYYRKKTILLSSIRLEESMVRQERRHLNELMFREEIMLSLMKNEDGLDTPAILVRDMGDGTYALGDGRHRVLMALAMGCLEANAWVVKCPLEVWDEVRREFNEINGGSMTEEERILGVHRIMLKGGCGPKEIVCKRHGVPMSKYNDYVKRLELAKKAEEKGLKVSPHTPLPVIAAAIESPITVPQAQKLIEVGTPVHPESKVKPNKSPSKKVLEQTLKPLAKPQTQEEFEKTASALQTETRNAGKRGRNKTHYERFSEGLKMMVKASRVGTPQEIGIPSKPRDMVIKQLEQLLIWARGK